MLPSHRTTRPHPHHSLRATAPYDSPFHEDEDSEVELEVRSLPLRQARLSVSAQAHQVWARKRTRRWYSVVAGAVAGAVAVSCEKKTRRVAIAQQMFVRGLQGSFNAFSEKHGVSIPHG